MEKIQIVYGLLVILCILAALDLWRQFAIKNDKYWQENYSNAVKSDVKFWNLGYKIEELELKLETQSKRFNQFLYHVDSTIAPRFSLSPKALRHNLHNIEYTHDSLISLHEMLHNDTQVYQITCESNGPQLRVGVNDYRSDKRDECQLFTSPKTIKGAQPHSMFDLIPVFEGSFALRAISNGNYLKVVPPPNDNSALPWKIVLGGTLIGLAETFRLTDEGYLYSALMGGFLTCGGGQMVSGYPGVWRTGNRFALWSVSREEVAKAYSLVHLSNRISDIQQSYLESKKLELKLVDSKKEQIVSGPTKICIAVPVTSKGTDMKLVADSPFWVNLFDSFMRSIDWRSNKIIFKFFIGFDRADNIYDTGDAWSDMREEFKNRAIFRMTEQMMDEVSINKVFSEQLAIKLMHFDHLEGAPSQVVSQLVLTGYSEGFDYFYQVNDDTVIDTPNWPTRLISVLQSNPIYPNLGVTGPSDSNNEKIFTHSFTHRTHIDIFGHYFPPVFKNWWSDDWISTVYGPLHTFTVSDVIIKHNLRGQKLGSVNRYQVDQSAQFFLEDELRKGYIQIDRWLKEKSLPRLILPEICGYVPSVKFFYDDLKAKVEVV